MTDTIACPTWCTTNHTLQPIRIHKGPDLGSRWGAPPVRIVRVMGEDNEPRVVAGGQLLDEAAAHELGMALVRAADTLRRERQAAEQAVTA